MLVSELDKVERPIEARSWMRLCLPSGNPTTSSRWRKQVGLLDDDGEPTKQKHLSRYHAMLLLVRSRLEQICAVLEEPRPKAIDCFVLESIADRWSATLSQQEWRNAIAVLLGEVDMPAKELKEVLAQWGLGKSERSIRRYLAKAGLPTSLRRSRKLTALDLRSIHLANVG